MNRPRLPAEMAAWRLSSSAGGWRPPVFGLKRQSPVLDWAACRAAHNSALADWSETADVLREIEAGAAQGARDLGGDD